MRDNSTVQVQCITQYTLPSSPRPPPTVQRQYNIAYVRRGQTVRTVRVARCPVRCRILPSQVRHTTAATGSCMGNLFARLLGDGAAEVEKNTPFPVTEFLTL